MKIGPKNPAKSNDYNRQAKPSLMQTRDKVRKVARKIPHAFTAGKVHFSKLKANKISEKTDRLFTQKMNTLNS